MLQLNCYLAAAVLIATVASAEAQPRSPAPTPATPQASPTTAPQTPFKRIQIGAKVGLNFASAASEPDDERVSSRTGLSIGGFANYAISPRLVIEAGLGYSQRGFRLRADFFPETNRVVELDYFEVPVLIGGRFPMATSSMLRIYGGINTLILDAARSRDLDTDETLKIEDEITDYDVSIIIGVGIDVPMGSFILVGDLRYDAGLVNTLENPDLQFESYRNRVGALLVGVAF